MDQIAIALDRAARAIDASITRELTKHGIELDACMARVLHSIGDGRVTFVDLSKLGFYAGNAFYHRQQLVTRGFVRQVAVGRQRARIMALTEKGRAVRQILVDLFDRQTRAAERLHVDLPLVPLQQLERFIAGLVV